jgi:hypothetical protein
MPVLIIAHQLYAARLDRRREPPIKYLNKGVDAH